MRKMFFLTPEASETIAREKYAFVSGGLLRNLKIYLEGWPSGLRYLLGKQA